MIKTSHYASPLAVAIATKLDDVFYKAAIRGIVKRGKFRDTLARFKSREVEGEECAKVLAHFEKEILNHSEGVWWGERQAPDEGNPVQINEYHGIYWAWTLGEDLAGYFFLEHSAISFVEQVWNARKGRPTVEDGEEVRCPYCRSTGSCAHHLLTVDITSREAHGGGLYDEFNRRLGAMEFHFGEELSEAEIFEQVLQQVALFADTEITEFVDLGPGQSSEYEHYYCESQRRTVDVVRRFRKG
jgi:hypothetical protein